jgi:hypothetical protein
MSGGKAEIRFMMNLVGRINLGDGSFIMSRKYYHPFCFWNIKGPDKTPQSIKYIFLVFMVSKQIQLLLEDTHMYVS